MWAPMAASGGMHLLVLALLLPSRATAQDTNLTVSNQVCNRGDWQVSDRFCAWHWPFCRAHAKIGQQAMLHWWLHAGLFLLWCFSQQ